MRQISFALTTQQIRKQTRTVTRRLSWKALEVGTLLQPIEKGQGLKKGESPTFIGAPIRVVSVRREQLMSMKQDDCAKEGFPDDVVVDFLAMFCEHNKVSVYDEVTRIEFEHTVTLTQAQTAFMYQHGPHLHQRAGEEFEREPSNDPRLDWLRCPSCGEMLLVQAEGWYRELSSHDAAKALTRAFNQQLGARGGGMR